MIHYRDAVCLKQDEMMRRRKLKLLVVGVLFGPCQFDDISLDGIGGVQEFRRIVAHIQ